MGLVKHPSFLTQGPIAGLGRVLVLGLVLSLRTTCTSVCSCSAPPWICPPKAVWGDASVLLPARTFSPLLGRDDTSPGNLPNSQLAGEGQPLAGALGLACWGLGKGLQQLGGHRAEPTKHSLEPLCRALLSWKSCVQSSPALQLWLQGRNVTCPAAAAVGGAWAPMALGHDLLTRGLRREMGV